MLCFLTPLQLVVTMTLTLLVCWLHWRWRNRRLLELAGRVPGPPALPVLGNALLFMASPNDQLKLLEEVLNRYGQYVKFWMGPDLNIFVKNPDDIKVRNYFYQVTKNDKGPVYRYIKEILGPGIFTGGKVWRSHRKIVTPSYDKKSVRDFERVFNAEAASMVQALSEKDPKQTFNIYWDVVYCTTQCVCQTLMGLSKHESQNLKYLDEVMKNTQSWYGSVFLKTTKWYLQIPPVYWLTGTKRRLDKCMVLTQKLTDEILETRRKALARTREEHARCAVDRFLMSGELTEEEIRQETFTVFTTSQEASAKILSAVLVFLAHLPEWQDKVFDEIQECLRPDDDYVTADQLKRLPSLDMMFKEALRYMSIGPLIQRTVEKEVTIDNGRITLPVGTSLVFPIHILHRDPQYWDEPNKVKPDRFLPENVKRRNPNAFIPFSSGPMDCLGRVFATAIIKTSVVHVLRHLRLEADGRLEDLDIQIAISVKFATGYNLRATPRKLKSG